MRTRLSIKLRLNREDFEVDEEEGRWKKEKENRKLRKFDRGYRQGGIVNR